MNTIISQNITKEVGPSSQEWVISFKDPRQLWTENWFALALEVISAVALIQVFRKAIRNDTKSAYLILTAVSSAIFFEILPIIPRPGYVLWWYHQGLVNVLKQRVPSYIITVFALVHYMAHCLTNRSNLPALTRSLVTAVCGTLIMFPCLWFAPKLLLVVLHFDDPVFKDQIAGVPYIQLVVMLLLLFHTSQLFHQNYESIELQERNTYNFIKCSIKSGSVSAIYTIVEQYLLYLLINLICRLNTGFCLVAAVLVMLYLAKDEFKKMQMTSFTGEGLMSPLMRKQFWIVLATFLFTSTLPLWLNMYDLRSSGNRLEMGPCHITQEVSNTSPLDVIRRRYICPEDAGQLHFDFHCLSKEEISYGVHNKTKHYTICGKNIENSSKIFKIFTAYSAGCLTLFYVLMLFSFTFKVQEERIVQKTK